ncbi:tetratricopeptide repeat protein [uncultured Roseovarius sp.]|uniref:tetratricopeptide repeat protein n=1 Tax=uncultured Roseovarius sp. TaxID=293344 RepID=UPI00260800D4|nr:tetratricopeptide repeat protein [uncultured Roseovarius sp.]
MASIPSADRRKRAVVLRRLGRHRDACDLCEELHREQPDDPTFACDLAICYRLLGASDRAEDLARGVLNDVPNHAVAQGLLIDIALERGDLDQALARADTALVQHPDEPKLRRKRAAVLRRFGRYRDACDLCEELYREQPDDPSYACDLAVCYRLLGASDRAEDLARGVLNDVPNHVAAQGLLIDIPLERGDVDQALARADAALVRCPDEPKLRRKRAVVLRRLGRHRDACDLFEELHREQPDDPAFACDLAVSLRQLGAFDRAKALAAQVLATRPDYLPARKCQLLLAKVSGEQDAVALPLTETQGSDTSATSAAKGGGEPIGRSWSISPEERLLLIDQAKTLGDDSRAKTLLIEAGERLDLLSEDQLTRLFHIAQRLESFDLLAKVIRHIRHLQSIKPRLALAVLRISHSSEHVELSQELIDCLAAKMGPDHEVMFRAQAKLLLVGPFDALASLRSARRHQRSPREAQLMAVLLLSSANFRLAIRYLRFCVRRWPQNRTIRSHLVNAYAKSGFPETGSEWLKSVASTLEPEELETHQLALLIAKGKFAEALDIVERQVRAGKRTEGEPLHLRLLIFLGRHRDAEKATRVLKQDPARKAKVAAHFNASKFGALLTELRLYKASSPSESGDATATVNDNYFVGHDIVQRTLEAAPFRTSPRNAQPVPHRIVQYWNHPTPPPEITQLMSRWQAVEGWEYVLHNKQTAKRWLRETLGPRYARAFSLARHVAQESDFLRLCLLLHGGGIYADADDVLLGDPKGLLTEGGGLVVFAEPQGSLMNNIICAPPRHPAIAFAVQMAGRALLLGDNESTWSKTGPGLLTRAVGRHISENPAQAEQDTTILRDIVLRRYVSPHFKLPYKSTAKYWNSDTVKLSDDSILSALTEFARHGRESRREADSCALN